MKAIIASVAAAVFFVGVCNGATGAEFKKPVFMPDQILIQGTADAAHDLVVEIEGWKKPTLWIIRGPTDDSQFSVNIRTADNLPLFGGKLGNGIVMTVTQGKYEGEMNISLKAFGNGKCVFRSPSAFESGKNSCPVADIVCSDGKTLPLIVRLSPAKK